MITLLSRFLYQLSFRHERRKILKRSSLPNVRNSSSFFADCGDGFEIQSSPKKILSWDTTYKSLSECNNAIVETDRLGNKTIKFKSRIRVGNFMFSDIEICQSNDELQEVPLRRASINIDSDGSPKCVFHTLYSSLLSMENAQLIHEEQYGVHNSDVDFFCVEIEGIEFSASIEYKNAFLAKDDNLILSIENNRKHDSYLAVNFELHFNDRSVLGAKSKFSINKDYRKSTNVKRITLSDLKSNEEAYVAKDKVNNKLIFASGADAIIVELEVIKFLSFQRIIGDRFGTSTTLAVNFIDGTKLHVFNMPDDHDTNELYEQIARVAPCEVRKIEDDYCD
ncbi:MAG: hypothetical protein NT150_00180 [Bacteroidetes bacterium]|nr:hypothetical protein [Bacteroidota bacterium]